MAAAMACGLQTIAKPAKQGILTVPVADGTEINVYLRGDEFFHQYFTEDGYPLFEKDGYFYYGDYDADGNVIDSGIKAVDADKRGQAARQFLAGVDKTKLEEHCAPVCPFIAACESFFRCRRGCFAACRTGGGRRE